MKTTTLFLALFLMTGCQSIMMGGDVNLTPEEQAVHTVSDTTGCDYIGSDVIVKDANFVHKHVKQYTHLAGGNRYKILSTEEGSNYTRTGRNARVNFEVWRC